MAICEPQNTRGPSERLLLQQSMDSSVKKKRKQRDNVKPGEKEALFALREQYSEISLKEFQQVSSLFSFLFFSFLYCLRYKRLY